MVNVSIPNVYGPVCEYHITEGVPVEWFWFVVVMFFGYVILSEIAYERTKNKKMSNVQQDNG